ncbi:hypothetical protein LJC13_03260 [Peptostreptococcaceae bacterium OttesenSCG-928-C18]|nr:hypothetical protein [Peptostreptococcaceae bacterium OttesenSCG-928-C18]
MFENLGFSYVGMIFILMLTVPNIIWTKNLPTDYETESESKLLLIFERVGQVCVTAIAVTTKSFNIYFSSFGILLIIAFLIMVLYEYWWIRYFKSERSMLDFYSSFLGVPVAGATLPVIAFFILGIYGKSIPMLVAVSILGVGHIGIHLEHRKKVMRK